MSARFFIVTLAVLLALSVAMMFRMAGFLDAPDIHNEITLYDAYGSPIKTWTSRGTIGGSGSTAYWRNEYGKRVRISGTFTIEEQ